MVVRRRRASPSVTTLELTQPEKGRKRRREGENKMVEQQISSNLTRAAVSRN